MPCLTVRLFRRVNGSSMEHRCGERGSTIWLSVAASIVQALLSRFGPGRPADATPSPRHGQAQGSGAVDEGSMLGRTNELTLQNTPSTAPLPCLPRNHAHSLKAFFFFRPAPTHHTGTCSLTHRATHLSSSPCAACIGAGCGSKNKGARASSIARTTSTSLVLQCA